jgi:hypothetical protein
MNRQIALAAVIAMALLGVISSGLRGAGTNAADEAAIRKLIAAYDEPGGNTKAPRLADGIFWSGAFKRPFIAPEKGEPFGGPFTVQDRVPGSQKSKTQPIRIVIADSRDLAYEYSKGTLEYDMKNGQHRSLDHGILRVWQKQGGDWKIAATFMRPYDEGFVAQ